MPTGTSQGSQVAVKQSDTRTRILDAARDLFVSMGYARVTMRSIAQAIGYTPTTIYLHFKDKDTMLRELVAEDFFAMTARFHQIAKIADPFQRLRAMGMAYVEYGLSFPNHYRLIFMTDNVPEIAEFGRVNQQSNGDPERDAYAFLTHTVAACIASGRVRPEYHDTEKMAQMMWSTVHGIVSLYIAKSQDAWINWRPPIETAEALIDSLARGLALPDDAPSVYPAVSPFSAIPTNPAVAQVLSS